jgi:lysine-specific histone demethylase 1
MLNLFVDFQMLALREKIEELNKQYKEQCEGNKGPRDITQEFVLRSKLRDLNNCCQVSVFCRDQ